jgi:hypothetical protein
MNAIEIKEAPPIEASYKGVKFTVQRPKVMFLRDFKKRMKACQEPDSNEEVVDVLIDFCQKVGVPDDVMSQWGMNELGQFFESMSEGEKKS